MLVPARRLDDNTKLQYPSGGLAVNRLEGAELYLEQLKGLKCVDYKLLCTIQAWNANPVCLQIPCNVSDNPAALESNQCSPNV